MLVPMPSRRTVHAVNSITVTAMKGQSTLVPHANEIEVAAMTDTTLAALNLFPDIAERLRRPGVSEIIKASP